MANRNIFSRLGRALGLTRVHAQTRKISRIQVLDEKYRSNLYDIDDPIVAIKAEPIFTKANYKIRGTNDVKNAKEKVVLRKTVAAGQR